ncbi:twin-arginine translocase TatA/TatE family subunit [Streptomyces tateyamensis]|uniref:Sec-independent protein translocase protein TatA n=1 Tax=Streptomyces tateyamensis TaxID=565073 RepID=A0A2V4NVS0_9ACTN|nr:Sec-independent protein translocase subunit TatA [Streptomyces tateyamensis]PYC87955.1 twin-arginine translocase TatA/TatE family subunit [Streptomyces tateyamensis]
MFRNGLEPWHLLVVLAVLILLFGSKKLPEMARGLGKSMRILKAETKAMREDDAPADNIKAQSTATEQARPAVEPITVTKVEDVTKPQAS